MYTYMKFPPIISQVTHDLHLSAFNWCYALRMRDAALLLRLIAYCIVMWQAIICNL